MMVAFVCVLVLFVVNLALLFAFQDRARNLQRALYVQCQQRQRFDDSAQSTRRMFQAYYQDQIVYETRNKFIDNRLRKQWIDSDRVLIDALGDTLGKTVHSGCGQYRP